MGSYIFTKGDVNESIEIMREAAQWLIDMENPLWSIDEITREQLHSPPDAFLVMYDEAHNSIATLLLSFQDPFFWPHVPAGTSGFIHKVAIRRQFAGKARTKLLIDFAADICREKGISCIRLDCDANRKRLCAFYSSAGFTLVGHRQYQTTKYSVQDVAFFEKHF